MMTHDVTKAAGRHPRRKRVGRGESSGMGRQAGRGNKGAQSRSGYSRNPIYEGGQMPMFRRLAKRGFSNVNFRREYAPVNIGWLDANCSGSVSLANLRTALHLKKDELVKVLGGGELKKKLSVEAHAFSAAAKAAIEKAGGSVKIIEQADPAESWKAKRNTAKNAGPAKKPA
ncbi:50S ribosomal protein L15 [Phycisphaerae bacterium RAS1]|nr:50S ribosomal protein L15 [Phycisphaerae bacterium RAS1]